MSESPSSGAGPRRALDERLGVVVIGRNEAPRLKRALAAVLAEGARRVVYVDSGSTDGSAEIAERAGVDVIRLSEEPFTAARGRSVGLDKLTNDFRGLEYVQFVDGDCTLCEGWLADAANFLDADSTVAAVVGRLREEQAAGSLLIRLVDVDWDIPAGPTDVIGGISLMRVDALAVVGGWRADLVAGEELELSARLRGAGYRLHRLAREMCRHDIGITHLAEFWRRSLRTGHSYAQLSMLNHVASPKRWRRRALGSLVYGVVLPLTLLVGLVFYWPAAIFVVGIFALLIVRVAMSRLGRGDPLRTALAYAALTACCKSAAGLGVLKFMWAHCTGESSRLIEYKAVAKRSALQSGRR